jgi:hypothetical protein
MRNLLPRKCDRKIRLQASAATQKVSITVIARAREPIVFASQEAKNRFPLFRAML